MFKKVVYFCKAVYLEASRMFSQRCSPFRPATLALQHRTVAGSSTPGLPLRNMSAGPAIPCHC